MHCFDRLILKIKKKIILIYFKIKNILNNNFYYIIKQDLNSIILKNKKYILFKYILK
jgi:hypothetical protein